MIGDAAAGCGTVIGFLFVSAVGVVVAMAGVIDAVMVVGAVATVVCVELAAVVCIAVAGLVINTVVDVVDAVAGGVVAVVVGTGGDVSVKVVLTIASDFFSPTLATSFSMFSLRILPKTSLFSSSALAFFLK